MSILTVGGVITLHETKNGERRALPLAGHALELMKQHAKIRHVNTELVFPGNNLKKPVDLRTPFETALKRSEINDFRWSKNGLLILLNKVCLENMSLMKKHIGS